MSSALPAHVLPWLFRNFWGCLFPGVLLPPEPDSGFVSQGILPIRAYLIELRESLGSGAFRHCPTLFWLNSSDRTLTGGACFGIVLSLLLIAGAPAMPLFAAVMA